MEHQEPNVPNFIVEEPYPPVQVQQKNRAYANAMLSNIGGENSEMTAVSLYFYDQLVTREDVTVSHIFHRISIVEMHHLEIFGTLSLLLGEDPRLWSTAGQQKRYWTPAYNTYTWRKKQLLQIALKSEQMAIAKYRSQLKWIKDPNILENLQRILLDEESHVRIFQWLLEHPSL